MSKKRYPCPTFIVLCLLLAACGGLDFANRRSTTADLSQEQAGFEVGDIYTRQEDGMTMVFVPGGEFKMGRRWSFQDPVHTVVLDSFWIDKTEVTNAHFVHCVEAGVCPIPTSCSWGESTYQDAGKQDHPVVCISWQIANNYCQWVGARLPTEAEWEYTARGPDSLLFPWGQTLEAERINSCDRNCPHEDHQVIEYDDGYAQTSPVGIYLLGSSWCGAMDMIGNAWEWVADWYGPYPRTTQTNPTGPETGTERIIRGGSWFENNDYGFLRGDNRHPYEPKARDFLVGFRCAIPLEE